MRRSDTRFASDERQSVLAPPVVGPEVLVRLEEIGLRPFEHLRAANAKYICDEIAVRLRSTCWRDSPQAQRAMIAAIDLAHSHSHSG
jgi:hypothetical protein